MEKKKLKPFVMPMVYGIAFAALLMSLVMLDNLQNKTVMGDDSNYQYVNNSIITSNIPVVAEESSVIKPYTSDKVEILKKFYDSKSSDEEKQNAIIYYNDTYMQNSGILYKSSESFDIITILDGTVIDVKKDEILGNIVEVKHSNNLISTYEGLSSVNVKKDQLLKQGDIIGKSGKLELGENIENGLLFELINDGKYVNPLDYFDKKISEI
ncbi:MAG: M23 family metallopeptidase [Bacilli bacterium]|nr:M23 family metallopeptidase [Bacilli bacterium]